ncbi:MAG TPA: DUF192 domain-containing protein [Vicinamibacterales bacterium]|nr:DUF192 domain-containing protein [Vicinamibacterales bacterium]
MSSAPFFAKDLVGSSSPARALINHRHGQIVAARLLTAFDSASRKTGLLKHTSMPEDTGLIIAPCNAIHMFFMRFPIDAAFVAKDGRVLKTVHALKPWRIAAAWGAFAVIELAAGALARTDTRPGDVVALR